MSPLTIIGAIQAADFAIDAAVKVKNHFFSPKRDERADVAIKSEISVTLETLQTEVNLQKRQLAEMADEVADNRTIIQEQNEIIIELSSALKVTAEAAKRLRVFMFIFAAFSLIAISVALYALFR